MRLNGNHSIVALDTFIQATRDSGYRGTVSAVSELIDNALQASARRLEVRIDKIEEVGEFPIVISVLDDGHGMDPKTLRQALRFGGSTRFNDRGGLGRYGMGLPNASLSQARRVEVFSWTEPNRVHYTYLDLDEIASGEMVSVPLPRRTPLPQDWERVDFSSGTLVVWSWCDRLENRRISTLDQKLRLALGRIFRYFLWAGVEISVNAQPVVPFDPLYLREPSLVTGGRLFDEPLVYEVMAPSMKDEGGSGKVTVTFSELPVREWHDLPNEEKRRLGVSNGAGVSVIRGGREIDFGWFFLTGKRRENYDDWWRAEVRFDPVLDELFGITHTKQEIRPHETLLEILSTEMSEVARILNARVREAHTTTKLARQTRTAESLAQGCDDELREIRNKRTSGEEQSLVNRLREKYKQQSSKNMAVHQRRQYRIIEDDFGGAAFYKPIVEPDCITIVINPRHRFYKKLYHPLMQDGASAQQEIPLLLQLLLLSAARAEAAAATSAEARAIAAFREEWSAVLEVLLKA